MAKASPDAHSGETLPRQPAGQGDTTLCQIPPLILRLGGFGRNDEGTRVNLDDGLTALIGKLGRKNPGYQVREEALLVNAAGASVYRINHVS